MFTYYMANRMLDALTARGSVGISNSYIGLSTSAPARDGSGVGEPSSDTGYARVLLGASGQSATLKMNSSTNGAINNKDIIYFPEATSAWGTCTHFVIYDSATGGNLLAYGELESSIAPVTNTIPMIRVGNISLTLV